MIQRIAAALVCALLLFPLPCRGAGGLPHTFQNAGPAVADHVFLQEIGSQIPTKTPLTAVACFNGEVFAGSAEGLFKLAGNALAKVEQAAGAVRRLSVAGGALWVISAEGLYRFDGSAWTLTQRKDISDTAFFASNINVTNKQRQH